MSLTAKVSVIVSVYNEGKRLAVVLAALKQAKLVGEIIVVDDGSVPPVKLAASRRLRVIRHRVNRGKTQAIKTGVAAAGNEDILLMDADLIGLSGDLIDRMIGAYYKNDRQILLGVRQKTFWLWVVFGLEMVFTGERILPKAWLVGHKELLAVSGYLFEPAMNQLVFGRESVAGFILPGVSQLNKVYKTGIKGLISDLKMHWRYWQFLGIRSYIWQCWYVKNRVLFVR